MRGSLMSRRVLWPWSMLGFRRARRRRVLANLAAVQVPVRHPLPGTRLLATSPTPTMAGPRTAMVIGYPLARKAVAIAAIVGVIVAYTGGVSYAHWTATVRVSTEMNTGVLGVGLDDPPAHLPFFCETRFPADPISFVRLWDPTVEPPEPPTSSGTGAVKIEEDGIEVGDPSLSIVPYPVRIGEPVSVTFAGGAPRVDILGWVAHGVEADRYVGFTYEVVPGDAEIVVDVKHGPDIERTTLTGTGLWPPDGAFDGPDDDDPDDRTDLIVACEVTSQSGSFGLANDGSIPVTPYLRFTRSPDDGDGDQCSLFEVSVTEADAGVLFEGSMCSLLGSLIELDPQLDPGEVLELTLDVSLVFPLPEEDGGLEAAERLVGRVTFVQWTSGAPGGPGFYGWSVFEERPVEIRLTILPPPEPSPEAAAPVVAEEVAEPAVVEPVTEEPAAEPPVEEPPAEPPGEEPPGEEPPGEEPPAEEPPAEPPVEPPGEEPPAEEPPAEPPGEELPPAPPELGVLSGHAWHDLNRDGVKVHDETALEPEVRKVTVVLYETSDDKVAQRKTDKAGNYEFVDLEPGEYYLEFEAPAAYGFRDPAVEIEVDLEALMEELEIEETAIVVDDLFEVWSEGDGEDERWFARTEVFTVVAGENDPVGDAALVAVPDPEALGAAADQAAQEPADLPPDGGEDAAAAGHNPNASAPTPPRPPTAQTDGASTDPPSGDGGGEPPDDPATGDAGADPTTEPPAEPLPADGDPVEEPSP